MDSWSLYLKEMIEFNENIKAYIDPEKDKLLNMHSCGTEEDILCIMHEHLMTT
jgi:hypothetical protein